MLLGITFSNLSTEQKNLKAQKKNHVCRVLEPGHSAKVALPSASCGHSAKIDLCRVPRVDTRQRLNAVSHPNGGRACWARARSLPSAGPVALGKEQWLPSAILCRRPALGEVRACRVPRVCRVPFGWHSAKIVFAECPWSGTRQRPRHSATIGFPIVKHI